MSKASSKNPWDDIAAEYDSQFGDEGDYSHKFIIYPELLKRIGYLENKKILDLGCGTGTLSRILANKNAEVYGIDYSEKMIKIAKSKKGKYRHPITYKVFDARENLDFKDSSFDIVIQLMILHSIRENYLHGIINETSRILKDNGYCFIVIPHPFFAKEFKSIEYPPGELYLSNYKTFFVWKQFSEICKSPTEFYLRPLEYYTNLFRSGGFLIENIFEPKLIDTPEALIAKPNNFNRRREIPGFMMIKLIKSNL